VALVSLSFKGEPKYTGADTPCPGGASYRPIGRPLATEPPTSSASSPSHPVWRSCSVATRNLSIKQVVGPSLWQPWVWRSCAQPSESPAVEWMKHKGSLVRESRAYPHMDFQKSTVITWIAMIFGCQSSILLTSVDIHIDIQTGIYMQGHFTMDVRERWISTNWYPCFLWIRLLLSMLLLITILISIDFYGYPCLDLLWILDPGNLQWDKSKVLFIVQYDWHRDDALLEMGINQLSLTFLRSSQEFRVYFFFEVNHLTYVTEI